MIKIPQIIHHLKRLIKASGDLIEKIPKKDDDALTIALKTVSLADDTYEYFNGASEPVTEFMNQFALENKVNKQFVHLFFKSLMRREFKTKQISIDISYVVIVITIPNNGSLYFVQWRDGNEKEYLDRFYYTKSFDFESLLNMLWEKYEGKIYVSPEADTSWKKLTSFSTFPDPKGPVYGSSVALLRKLKKKNLFFRKENVSRAYMFIGKPGTGKSTSAIRMTEGSSRVIKFDSKCLEAMSVTSMEFLLSNLLPKFIIIDDIDKIIFGNAITTLLYVLEIVKSKYPDTYIIVTANEINKMDPAILRPGRIDEITIFSCDEEDRKQIINGYLTESELILTEKEIDKIIQCTSGLTGAFIKEFVIQLKYLSLDEVIIEFNQRRRLMGLTNKKSNKAIEDISNNDSKLSQ